MCSTIFRPTEEHAEPRATKMEKMLEVMSNVKDPTEQISVNDIISEQKEVSLIDKKMLTFNKLEHSSYFVLTYTKFKISSGVSHVIILHDQTAIVVLDQLNEKYNRIFLASVVHDIRTPLNGIQGMLEMIEEFCNTPEAKKYLQVARGSTKLLMSYTYDITDFTQIEARTFSLHPEAFLAQEAMQECIDCLSFNFERKGLKIQCDFPSRSFLVFSDKNRYKQIIMNLLMNALKFTFRGGVEIKLEINEGNDMLYTSVKDSGIGIKPESIGSLFKLFGKLRESTSINPTGVGLGLTICKKLAELMGGSIWVNSVYGEGTQFTFTIKRNTEKLPQDSVRIDFSIERENSLSEWKESDHQNLLASCEAFNFQNFINNNPLLHSKTLNSEEKKEKPEIKQEINVILAVDDNESNLFVLQSYAKLYNISLDIVTIFHKLFRRQMGK